MTNRRLLAAALFASLPASALADPPVAPAAHRETPPRPAERSLPQACEQDPFHVDYGPIRRGSLVRLGRHRAVEGTANWDPAMEHWVGRVSPVVAARGLDPQGCAIVQVAIDGGEYVWRVRDLEVVAGPAPEDDEAPPEVRVVPGAVRDPRVFEAPLPTVTRESDDVKDGCSGWIGDRPTLTVLVEDDLPTLSILVHADVDTVLLVRAPDGHVICVDDVDARDPVLTGRAEAGRYEVFVGTFEPVSGSPTFRLGLSERGTVHAPALADVANGDVQPLRRGSEANRTRLQVGRPARPAPESDGPSAGGGDDAMSSRRRSTTTR